MNRDNGRRSVKVFVFHLTKLSAVNRVGKLCAKILHLKPVCAAANLLIRSKSNTNLSVRNFFMGKQISGRRHNFCHTGFVICTKQCGSICCDQILSLVPLQERKLRNPHGNLLFCIQTDVMSIIIFYNLWLYIASSQSWCRIHMGNKPQCRYFASLIFRKIRPNLRINITIFTQANLLCPQLFQFLF